VKESRLGNKCRSLPVTTDGCPISARFWQMWDSTALDRLLSLLQPIPRSMIIYTLYSQRQRSVESGLNGAPSLRCRY
jgi:hypothetical protein